MSCIKKLVRFTLLVEAEKHVPSALRDIGLRREQVGLVRIEQFKADIAVEQLVEALLPNAHLAGLCRGEARLLSLEAVNLVTNFFESLGWIRHHERSITSNCEALRSFTVSPFVPCTER